MSGRGGRGGGRGGFGGRGSAGNPITIDDDGQPVIGNADGPPSLYPPMPRMPPPPELTEREEELLRIHRRLNNFWRNSCYYMDDEPEAQEIPEVKIMTYRDRLAAQEKAKTEKKAELYDVLESYKDHFPEELWAGRGKKRKRGAGSGASKGARAIGGAADSDDRLERLARLEQEKGVGEEDVDEDVEKERATRTRTTRGPASGAGRASARTRTGNPCIARTRTARRAATRLATTTTETRMTFGTTTTTTTSAELTTTTTRDTTMTSAAATTRRRSSDARRVLNQMDGTVTS